MKHNLLLIVVIIILIVVIVFSVSPRSYYSEVDSNPILQRIHQDFIKLNPAYGAIPLREGSSSYTENKSVITICLKDPKTRKRYPYCVYLYVALHELAHMVSSDYGHGQQFQANFGTILRAAVEKGIYDPNCEIPSDYCGIDN